MKYCIGRLLLSLLFCFGITYSPGQSVAVLDNDHKDVALNAFAYVYKGDASAHVLDSLLGADTAAFSRNHSRLEVNYGFHRTRAWCKVEVRNESDEKEWVLMVQQARTDTLQLYMVTENGTMHRFPLTGHFQTMSQRPVHALPFAFPVHLDKGETAAFYLYTQREFARHVAVLSFQTRGYFERYQLVFEVGIAFICGMILLAALIGFVLFLFVKQRMYVYYSIYALSFFFVMLVDTGFLHGMVAFPGDQTIVNGFTIIFYYWLAAWHLLFTLELLQIRKYSHRWVYWAGLFSAYFFCLATFLLLIPSLPGSFRWWLVMISYFIIFPSNIYILYTISASILKKEPVVYLYMAGFFLTILVGTLLTLSDLEVLVLDVNKDFYYLTPLVEVLCMVMGFGIQFSKTLKERYNAQLKLAQTQDQIITIQEDERRRIAQDLHDDVGNSLAAVRNMVVQKRESAEVEKEVTNVISTIRAISHNLMPVDFNEFPLVDIIGHLVNKFKDHPSTTLDFDCSGEAIKLKPVTELVIYRIINEIITNVYKHSKATKAFIQLIYQKDSLVVTVEDNGIGMNNQTKMEGIGLKSIRLRAAYIQASLNVESDDKGTLIILEIPYVHA